MEREEFSDLFKAFFKSKKITQNDIAEAMNVPQSYINAILNGRKSIGKKNAEKMHELYGISPYWLLSQGDGNMMSDSPHTNNIEMNFGGDNSINGNKGNIYPDSNTTQVKILKERIASLEKENEELKKDKEFLKSLLQK